jgi:FkbM family methyltransferase
MLPAPLKKRLYHFGPLTNWIRGNLNRAAPVGRTAIQVAGGSLAGMSLLLDMQTEKDYWLGTYEPELLDCVQEMAKPGNVIYDVGANIGYVSLFFAKVVGAHGRVVAFEALPDNIERLRKNLELNGMLGRVQVIAGAVLDKNGPVRFLVGPSNGMGKAEGSAGRTNVSYTEAIEVNGLSLDSFVYEAENPAPDLVKIDIEGGEVLALPGMRRLLAEGQPLLLIELHGPESARAAWEALSGAGYRIHQIAAGFPQVQRIEDLNWKAYVAGIPERRRV